MRVIGRAALLIVALLAGLGTPALAGPATSVQPRVVGGASNATAQHPWMIALTTVAGESAYLRWRADRPRSRRDRRALHQRLSAR